jgi:hypothetical protein
VPAGLAYHVATQVRFRGSGGLLWSPPHPNEISASERSWSSCPLQVMLFVVSSRDRPLPLLLRIHWGRRHFHR